MRRSIIIISDCKLYFKVVMNQKSVKKPEMDHSISFIIINDSIQEK